MSVSVVACPRFEPVADCAPAELGERCILGLYERRSGSSILTKIDPQGVILEQKVLIDKSVFMLGGFALENALKAFLVYENPTWISNGRLAKNLKTHSLTQLQTNANLVPYRRQYLEVLEAFESGLESWFRYPCALTIEETKQERNLYSFLWEGYKRVMKSYGKQRLSLAATGRRWRSCRAARH
jgi:hypothetical protein